MRQLLQISILFLIVQGVYGCGNKELFSRIRKFSETQEVIQEAVISIGEDFYLSCLRRAEHLPLSRGNLIRTTDEIERGVTNVPVFQNRQINLSICDEEELINLGNQFIQSSNLIPNYMGALAALVGEDVLVFPNTTKNRLENAINTIASSNKVGQKIETLANKNRREDVVNFAANILQFISRLYFNQLKKETLITEITKVNESIQSYTQTLNQIVYVVYIDGFLALEIDNYDLYYSQLIEDIRWETFGGENEKISKRNTFAPSPYLSIDETWRKKRQIVHNQRKIALLYITLIDEVAQGHCELVEFIVGEDDEKFQKECPDPEVKEIESKNSNSSNNDRIEKSRLIEERLKKINKLRIELKKALNK